MTVPKIWTPGEVLTAEDLNENFEAIGDSVDLIGTYTPIISAPTPPNFGADGSITGRWQRTGNRVTVWIAVRFQGSGASAGSGAYDVSLPFDADTSFHPANFTLNHASESVGWGMVRSSLSSSPTLLMTRLVAAGLLRANYTGSNNDLSGSDPVDLSSFPSTIWLTATYVTDEE